VSAGRIALVRQGGRAASMMGQIAILLILVRLKDVRYFSEKNNAFSGSAGSSQTPIRSLTNTWYMVTWSDELDSSDPESGFGNLLILNFHIACWRRTNPFVYKETNAKNSLDASAELQIIKLIKIV
jgi:hypothetical protein